MITINPVNFNNKKYITFGEGNLNNVNSKSWFNGFGQKT